MLRTILRLALLASISGAQCACGPAKPPLLKVGVEARADANPDRRGRPSPVMIRVYELKSVAAFNSADYFSLSEREAETLAADLVGREEFALRPGDSRMLERPLQPDTRFVGVVAGFRDLEKAQWRASVALPAKRKKPLALQVTLAGKSVTMAEVGSATASQAKK